MVYVRFACRPDLATIANLDRMAGGTTPAEVWAERLRGHDYLLRVALVESEVWPIGFVCYHFQGNQHKRLFVIDRLAIHPNHRDIGAARELIAKICLRLTNGRNVCRITVSERADDAHRFLREIGFKATRVLRNQDHDGSDWYRFERNKPLDERPANYAGTTIPQKPE